MVEAFDTSTGHLSGGLLGAYKATAFVIVEREKPMSVGKVLPPFAGMSLACGKHSQRGWTETWYFEFQRVSSMSRNASLSLQV